VIVVANEHFRWTHGQDVIKSWKKPDADWQTWFCQTCGSTLPGINDEARMYVPAGVIRSGAESLEVLHHIWVGSRAAWDVIGDQGRLHPEAFSAN